MAARQFMAVTGVPWPCHVQSCHTHTRALQAVRFSLSAALLVVGTLHDMEVTAASKVG